MRKTIIQTVIALMQRGAGIIRIQKAAMQKEFTLEEMQRMHLENRMAFVYESSKDELIIAMDH